MLKIDRIESLISSNGLKKGAFCAMMGHSRTWIDDWKRGRGLPDENVIMQIASALHTTPAYLMGETDDPSEGKKNNPAAAQDARQRELVVLARRAEQIPDEDYKRIVKTFEDTIDIYLRARGLDPDDYR